MSCIYIYIYINPVLQYLYSLGKPQSPYLQAFIISNSSCGRVFPRDSGRFVSRDGDVFWKGLGGKEWTKFEAVASFSVVITRHTHTVSPEILWWCQPAWVDLGNLDKLANSELMCNGETKWRDAGRKALRRVCLPQGCFCHQRSSTVQTRTWKSKALCIRQSSSKSYGMWGSSLSISKGNAAEHKLQATVPRH